MAFEPEKITKNNILDAVKKIEIEGIELKPSTKFDVIINDKPYPPKEIMRYAHELMNGEYIWYKSGGEPTNKYLTKWGFEIKMKKAKELSELNLNGKSLYKMSHGIFIKTPWGRDANSGEYFKEKNWIVINEETGKGQGDFFVNGLRIGDYVYICYGSDKLSYFAEIVSDSYEIPEPDRKYVGGDDTWVYRKVKPLFYPVDDFISELKDDRRFWLPSGNSTLYKIPNQELEYFNKVIGIPKYQLVIIDGAVKQSQQVNNLKMESKNIILYGSPGTGKTYRSIDYAVNIAAGSSSNIHNENKMKFDELRKQGQIEFVTFHQNYCYEDFMVGVRPDLEFSELKFRNHKGIFYRIAKKARDNYFDSLKDAAALSYEAWIKDMMEDFKDHVQSIIEKDGKYTVKNAVSIYSVEEDAFVYTGIKADGEKWKNERLGMHYEPLISMFLNDAKDRKDIKNLEGIPSLEKQHATYCIEVLQKFREYLKSNKREFSKEKTTSPELKNFVLIIDEINRANISKVFGELITLLEDDKRLGEDNELKITLPNGEEDFGVPPNLYIIGTMNTADKSIALIDIALRRRFEFIGQYPEYEDLNEEESDLLKKINAAVFEKKKSADYLIGHAYFMKSLPIEAVLKGKVVPLLMEYFSGKTEIVSSVFENSAWSVKYDTTTFNWTISKN